MLALYVPSEKNMKLLEANKLRKNMYSGFRRSSYLLSWTQDRSISQMLRNNHYGRKCVTFCPFLLCSNSISIFFFYISMFVKKSVYFSTSIWHNLSNLNTVYDIDLLNFNFKLKLQCMHTHTYTYYKVT